MYVCSVYIPSVGFTPNIFEEAAALVPPKILVGFDGSADTVAPPNIDAGATQISRD